MTTIAYRSGLLAFDSLVSDDSCKIGFIEKARVLTNCMVAGAGNVEDIAAFLDWFERHGGSMEHRTKYFPENTAGSLSGLIIYRDGSIYMCDEKLYPYKVNTKFAAIGTGSNVALGAMLMGASAAKAVEIAAQIDTHTGGEIKVLTLVKKKVKKKK